VIDVRGLETEAIEGVRHRPRSSRIVTVFRGDHRFRLVYKWKIREIAGTGEYQNLQRREVQGNTRRRRWSLFERQVLRQSTTIVCADNRFQLQVKPCYLVIFHEHSPEIHSAHRWYLHWPHLWIFRRLEAAARDRHESFVGDLRLSVEWCRRDPEETSSYPWRFGPG